MPRDLGLDPLLEPRPKPGAPLGRQPVERAGGADRRLEQRTARGEPGKDMAIPADRQPACLFHQPELGIGRLAQRGSAAVELVAKPALGRGEQQPLVGQASGRIDPELESSQMSDRLRPDADFAVGGNGHRQRVGAARADVADQHGGATVDEPLGQAFVKCI